LSNKHLKGKYNDAFEVVQKIINEWDPLDLLALDCPDDEYESEVQLIVSATLNKDNVDKIAEKINEIFYKAFEDDFKKSNDCLKVAERIFKNL
jgi:hypothetical protein